MAAEYPVDNRNVVAKTRVWCVRPLHRVVGGNLGLCGGTIAAVFEQFQLIHNLTETTLSSPTSSLSTLL